MIRQSVLLTIRPILAFAPILLGVAASDVGTAQTLATVNRKQVASTEEDVILSDSQVRPRYDFTPSDQLLLDEIQRGCFEYLWREVGSPVPLAKDRRKTRVSSIAAVGFQLSALPIGVQRGWITRDQGVARATEVLRGLLERADNKKFGVYLHFVDLNTGGHTTAAPEVFAGTVDHALLVCGAIPAASFFGGEVAELVDRMILETKWSKYVNSRGHVSFGWRPEDKATIDGPGAFSPWDWWIASAEEQLVYFLACSAPDPPERVPPEIYYQLARATARHNDGPPFVLTWNGALFTYFFSQCWIDYRSFDADDPTQFSVTTPRVDWFENSRRATLTHRQRCIEAANEFKSFAADRWGLSPCTGFKPSGQPTYLVPDVMPNRSERDNFCFGTVAPYAAGSTIVFTPEESMQALRAMRELTVAGKPFAWQPIEEGGYGFVDSFNLDQGLASDDHVGIDVGPMLLAIENARTGLIWKLFMQHATSRRAVKTLKWQSRN